MILDLPEVIKVLLTFLWSQFLDHSCMGDGSPVTAVGHDHVYLYRWRDHEVEIAPLTTGPRIQHSYPVSSLYYDIIRKRCI